MPFHLDSLWDATLMLLKACAMDWRRNKILRVGKNFGPLLSRLRTKVHEILGQCRGPLYFQHFNVFSGFSVVFHSKGVCR